MNKIQTSSTTLTESSTGKPRRLGRGLSALLGAPVAIELPHTAEQHRTRERAPTSVSDAATGKSTAAPARAENSHAIADNAPGRVVMLELGRIRASRFQPRRAFDQAQLSELAASIKAAGVVQPIVVRPVGDGAGGFELIAGERRWRAAGIAGLERIPAIVSAASDEQAAEWALIENLQRADLKPMERADAVRALVERFALSHAQAAERLGIDRSSVANMVRMTELELPIREMLDLGTLASGHGKALLSVEAGAKRVELAKRAADQGWSVRKLEQAIAGKGDRLPSSAQVQAVGAAKSQVAVARGAAVKDLEKQLGEHLGTSVRIRTSAGGKRGNLVIRFFDLDHFDGLMQKFGFALK